MACGSRLGDGFCDTTVEKQRCGSGPRHSAPPIRERRPVTDLTAASLVWRTSLRQAGDRALARRQISSPQRGHSLEQRSLLRLHAGAIWQLPPAGGRRLCANASGRDHPSTRGSSSIKLWAVLRQSNVQPSSTPPDSPSRRHCQQRSVGAAECSLFVNPLLDSIVVAAEALRQPRREQTPQTFMPSRET